MLSVTFRLHDSVPAELLERWRTELSLSRAPSEERTATVPRSQILDARHAALRRRISEYEDAGYGACWLADPRIAGIVQTAILHFDGKRYRLHEWCVMPNHVHVLIETLPGHRLSGVIRSWKSFTARATNRLLGREGKLWMPDYFDRCVRDQQHFDAVRQYIRRNPVKAGLCESEEQWRWSSAWEENNKPSSRRG